MKPTIEEIERVINYLAMAATYAKEARRVAKLVYGSDIEIRAQLKYAADSMAHARAILERQQ